jgi:hypothetical protein
MKKDEMDEHAWDKREMYELGRPWHNWEYDTKIYLGEKVFEDVDRVRL